MPKYGLFHRLEDGGQTPAEDLIGREALALVVSRVEQTEEVDSLGQHPGERRETEEPQLNRKQEPADDLNLIAFEGKKGRRTLFVK